MSDPGDETGMRRSEFLRDTAGAALAATTLGAFLAPGAFAAAPNLAPFKPSAKVGAKPNLPKRIAFANNSDNEFFLAFEKGLRAGAKATGAEFVSAISNGDPAKNVTQMEGFLRRGICALMVAPGDAAAQKATMTQAIKSGVAVMTLIEAPSTVQINQNQFEAGRKQGALAAKHIKEKLGGNAEIAYFNLDTIESLRPRHQGVLAGLKTAGDGAKVVSDIQPSKLTSEATFAAMTTILQAHPNVKVVLGSDFSASGALAAIEAAGKVTDDMYIGGMDGENAWLDKVADKDAPVKTAFAFPTEVMGYAYSLFAADWLKGKSIPKGFRTPLVSITASQIPAYRNDMRNPGRTWKNKKKAYGLEMYGNISYATRNSYLKDIWVPKT